ncbi:unnamed protein product [Rotaria socialis]|uniref:U-box domain-containing protein n=1 Tax=Rotaria socialis TaxID=392032 RepID=A0A818C8G1_9BILA|nr:unnamed protein product [Rotaria socialis]
MKLVFIFMDPLSSSTVESSKDLICSITLQIFRDPALVGDGHIYERGAIVRWVAERGISLLTREPLNIN